MAAVCMFSVRIHVCSFNLILYVHANTFFNHVWMGHPGLNQYYAEDTEPKLKFVFEVFELLYCFYKYRCFLILYVMFLLF